MESDDMNGGGSPGAGSEQQAEARFDSEFDRHLQKAAPDFPEHSSNAVRGIAWQAVRDNPQVLAALQRGSDTRGVEEAVKSALELVYKIESDYQSHPGTRGNARPAPAVGTRNLKEMARDYLGAEERDRNVRHVREMRTPARRRATPAAGRTYHEPGTRNLRQIANDYLNGEED